MCLAKGARFRTITEIFGTTRNLLAPIGARGTVQKVFNGQTRDPRYTVEFDNGLRGITVYGHEIEAV